MFAIGGLAVVTLSNPSMRAKMGAKVSEVFAPRATHLNYDAVPQQANTYGSVAESSASLAGNQL